MAGVRENLTKIYEAYTNFFTNWVGEGVPVYLYDYTKQFDRDVIIGYIKREIERRGKDA